MDKISVETSTMSPAIMAELEKLKEEAKWLMVIDPPDTAASAYRLGKATPTKRKPSVVCTAVTAADRRWLATYMLEHGLKFSDLRAILTKAASD